MRFYRGKQTNTEFSSPYNVHREEDKIARLGCACQGCEPTHLHDFLNTTQVNVHSSKLPVDVRNKFCLPAPSKERYPSTLPGTHCSTKGTSRFAIRSKKSSGIWRFSAICWTRQEIKIDLVNFNCYLFLFLFYWLNFGGKTDHSSRRNESQNGGYTK